MSLRTFHIVFVACSVIMCFGAGAWGVQEYLGHGEVPALVGGVLSLASGVALIYYGMKVWRKLRALNRFGASVMLNVFLLCNIVLTVQQANACPSCYGDPDSSAAAGLNAAVVFLVGVTGSVFAAFGAFFLRLRRGAATDSGASDNQTRLT
jgi:hypothetical protein